MGDRVDLGVGMFACIWWLFVCMIECGDTEILACRVLTWLFKIAKSLEAGGGVPGRLSMYCTWVIEIVVFGTWGSEMVVFGQLVLYVLHTGLKSIVFPKFGFST